MDFSSMMDAARRQFIERQKQKALEPGRPRPYPGTSAFNPNTRLTMNPDRTVQQQMADKQIAERAKHRQMMEAYKLGGHTVPSNIPPVRPVKPPVDPRVEPAVPTPTKVQDRLAPNQYSDKGAMPTPKPNPWKTMGRELINQLATPGYYDRDRGVWVGSAHAYAEKKAGKDQKNKTVEFLKRKGHSKDDAEAIVAQGPDAIKEAMTAVKAPKSFDKRGFPITAIGGKLYATSPEGVLSKAQVDDGYVPKEVTNYERDLSLSTIESAYGNIEKQKDSLFGGKLIGTGSSGGYYLGELLPETDANEVAETLETLKAQEIMSSLQNLRAASKDGSSGLGQVTEKELRALEKLRVNLSTKQRPENIQKSLSEIHARIKFLQFLDSQVARGVDLQNIPIDSFDRWKRGGGYTPLGTSTKSPKVDLESLGIKRIN